MASRNARLRALANCEDQEAHEAHLQLNGECPWCGLKDESEMVPYGTCQSHTDLHPWRDDCIGWRDVQ